MKTRLRARLDLDRIERIYLAWLRIAVLGVATLCLAAGVFFGANAAWRVFVSTDVPVEPVEVTGADVAGELRKAASDSTAARTEDPIPASAREAHAAFLRDVFPQYHQVYRAAAQAYNKEEDQLLNVEQLAVALGYDLNTYAWGRGYLGDERLPAGEKAVLFIDNEEYRRQALEAVGAALADPAVVTQLQEYKEAEKTAQACTTEYETRRVWDSNSMACQDWWRYPQGCEVTRSVPVERCVPAYPEGIVSPQTAFGRADAEFFFLWSERSDQKQAAAQAERNSREATRAQIGPNLLLAIQILAAFVVVMFFFLMIAIERHLRRGGLDADLTGQAETKQPSAGEPPAV